ncbi:hypothetical protein ACLB1Q_36045 [Escherichia coli]
MFVAAHSQYQNLLTLAEVFLVGLITSAARIRSGGLLLVLLHMDSRWVYCLVESYILLNIAKAWCVFLVDVIFKYNFYGGEECIPPD